jgi:UDP-GlcNAc:undecaprenyl-phosphate GlcNAc-1-phosphate transferase
VNPLLAGGAALVVAAAAAPAFQRVAARAGLVSVPKADRWSQRTTPLLGGCALVLGVLAAAALSLPLADRRVQAVLAGALLMFAVGLWDDVKRLKPATKLAAQVAAGAILVLGGVEVEMAGRRIFGIPLTIFWVVGITNALNLLDNMDGLAAGVGAIAAGVLAVLGEDSGVPFLAPLALAVAGACLGFLPWNVSPARQFLGDAGSLPLGFLLAAAGILGTYREAGNVVLVLVAPVFVLGVPILDTTLVTLVRKFHGRSVSQGGKDHLSHRLVALGMSERRAVAVLWAVAAALGAVALLAGPDVKAAREPGTFVLFGLAAAGAAIFGVVLGEVKVYQVVPREDGKAERARETRDAFLYYFRAIAVVFLDLAFVAGAYAGAHALRFGGRGEPFDQARFFEALPLVILGKFVALQVFGLQRGFWRYFGLRDLASVAKAVLLGGGLAAAGIALVWGFAGFSGRVLLLDGILLFLFLVGSRAIYRLTVEHLAGFPADGERVVLVGAGEEGDLALRALRIRGGVLPVAVLDPDPLLRGRAFHGIPIVGAPADLADLLRRRGDVKEVVLARAPDPGEQERLRAAAHGAGARLLLAPTALRFTEI